MKLNQTANGRKIKVSNDIIIASINTNTQIDILSSLEPITISIKETLDSDISEENINYIKYEFERIEKITLKWRPLTYIEPDWASVINNETQVAIKLISELMDEFYSGLYSKINTKEEKNFNEVRKNEAFIAMAIDPANADLDDIHDAIKESCKACGISAKRVDEDQTNEKITDRIVNSIKSAEFVIADLTHARPNVYFEAGLAQGLEKTPIYIAKYETKLEFDIKDYPVIFFKNMRELKNGLEKRLNILIKRRTPDNKT